PDRPPPLSPLVSQHPHSTSLAWRREQLLLPVSRRRGRHKQASRGWRVHDDWQKRLAVMADPTPANLLQWWRELEPTLRVTCLQRGQREVLIYDRSVGADAGNLGRISVTGWFCTLCQAESWDDDPRGISHDCRSRGGRRGDA